MKSPQNAKGKKKKEREKIYNSHELKEGNTKDWASLVAQLVKNLPAMWETWVQSLGWEDPLEKGTATHSSVLAWRIPWTIASMGCKKSDMVE